MATDTKASHEGCMEAGQRSAEHDSLARLAGTWRANVRIWFQPGVDPMVSQGTMVNTPILGGRFLQQEYRDDTGAFEGRGFMGYNTVDKRYEAFWIDSMATFFNLEQGRHDAANDTYVLEGSMTNPETRQPMKKRSLLKMVSPNEHTMEMFFAMGGAPDFRTMEIRYTKA